MTAPGGPQEGRQRPGRDELRESVSRFGARRRSYRNEQGRAFGWALSMVGLGWVVVIPTLLGLLAGRWLDARFGTGLTLRAALGLAGLVLGCVQAWRRIAHRTRA